MGSMLSFNRSIISVYGIDKTKTKNRSLQGKDAKVGVIEYGGDVVPVMDKKR